jgi:hypothetical protein
VIKTLAGVAIGSPVLAALSTLFSLTRSVQSVGSATLALLDTQYNPEIGRTVNAGQTIDPKFASHVRAGVEEVAEALLLVSDMVPVLLAIDDAETLDDQTSDLVQTLASTRRGNITIVLAANPSAATGHWGEWLRSTQPGADALEPATVEWIPLAPLPTADLTDLGQHLAPGSHPNAMQGLVAQAQGQPGTLASYLAVASIREALSLESTNFLDLGRLTSSDPYDLAFHALSSKQQSDLELLAGFGPSTHSILIDRHFSLQPTPGWTITHDDSIGTAIQFVSLRHHVAALRNYARQFSHDQKREHRQALANKIASLRSGLGAEWTSLPVETRISALVSVSADRDTDPTLIAELADLNRSFGHSEDNESLIGRLTQHLGTGEHRATIVRAAADALLSLGRVTRAIAVCANELEAAIEEHGVDSQRS